MIFKSKKIGLAGSFSVVILACCILLIGCGSASSDSDNTSVTNPAYNSENTPSAFDAYDISYTDRDLDSSYDEISASKITLANDDVTITTEGTYILSGQLSDGQIIVDTPDDQKVQLVFDGVDISCSDSAPVHIKESDKVFITLADDRSNKLTGPSAYSATSSEDNIDGVIFSKADLCINGSGSLTVTAESGHGIVSKDDLVITGGSITVSAPGDGLQGKDCVKIKDGTFAVHADNDCIKSSNSEDASRGFVSIDGGEFTITAGYDGIQAETMLRVADGTFDITTGGGSENASTQDDWGRTWGGDRNQHTPGDMVMPGGGSSGGEQIQRPHNQQNAEAVTSNDPSNENTTSDTVSAKGLKGNDEIFILGGNISINSSDDAIHSNGDITMYGGDVYIASGDDGLHADSNLLVEGGILEIDKSYEGIEGNTLTVNGGQLNITASDDGLNAAGGADGSSVNGRAGQDPFAVDESAFIKINGSKLTISASGDGIDSNGTLDIADGLITISCPTVGDTSVLDYASEGTISGGTFIGTGAVQMAQTFNSSQQGVVAVSVGEQSSGATITLTDSNGNKVITHEASQAFAVVILSSPDIISGQTYTLTTGTTSGEVTAN